MSDRLKSTNRVSNEDVIEDLTKDLRTAFTPEHSVDEFIINPGSSAEDFPTSSGDAPAAAKVSGDNYFFLTHQNCLLLHCNRHKVFLIAL